MTPIWTVMKQGGRTRWFLVLLLSIRLFAQDKASHQYIGVSVSGMREVQNSQYIGFGGDYRFLYRQWLGFQVQGTQFPESQRQVSGDSGYSIGTLQGDALVGHRWGKAGLFGEVGYGYLSVGVIDYPNGTPEYDVRVFPDLGFGGLLDVSVSKRWSLTWEVRDNHAPVAATRAINGYTSPEYHATTLNAVEGRFGVAFRFR